MATNTAEGGATNASAGTQPMQVVQVVQVVQQAPDTLDARLKKVQCCCGCDAAGAVMTVAIIGLIFYLIDLTSFESLTSIDDAGWQTAGYLNLVWIIIAIICNIIGIVAASRRNLQAAKLFFYFCIGQIAVNIIWILVFVILIAQYPILIYFIGWYVAILAVELGFNIWYFFIARTYLRILEQWYVEHPSGQMVTNA